MIKTLNRLLNTASYWYWRLRYYRNAQRLLMPLSLGQIAYEAYCEVRNWTSVKGELLPQWHDQTTDLKTAWDAAAEAVKANLPQKGTTTNER